MLPTVVCPTNAARRKQGTDYHRRPASHNSYLCASCGLQGTLELARAKLRAKKAVQMRAYRHMSERRSVPYMRYLTALKECSCEERLQMEWLVVSWSRQTLNFAASGSGACFL